MDNRIKRKTLNEVEIEREIAAIKRIGFDSVLLVTGEHETKVGIEYFRRHSLSSIKLFIMLRWKFSRCSKKSMPS